MATFKFAKRSVNRADVIQFFKYFIGSSTYFWSGYSVFAIAYGGLHWVWWPAKLLADAIGWTLNYVAQRYWAFNTASLDHHELATAKKYAILTLLNFSLDYLIVGGLKHVGISPYIGLFVSAGFFTIWNYTWYRFWVFLGRSPAAIKGGS
jgi:putative flippase GtrA